MKGKKAIAAAGILVFMLAGCAETSNELGKAVDGGENRMAGMGSGGRAYWDGYGVDARQDAAAKRAREELKEGAEQTKREAKKAKEKLKAGAEKTKHAAERTGDKMKREVQREMEKARKDGLVR